ncbi:MAG: hypothetical protein OCD76_01860 [Reichenbachiella sp.]
MNAKVKSAAISILIGAFFIYWAMTHSPKSGLGNRIGNEMAGSYTMSEGSYYITLAIGAAAAVYGIWKLIKK